jgi:hypothetical protein
MLMTNPLQFFAFLMNVSEAARDGAGRLRSTESVG